MTLPKPIDKGTRFGRLITLGIFRKTESGYYQELCKCDCGKEHWAGRYLLKSGKVKSCGCGHDVSRKTHGDRYTKFYKIWKSIKWRCNPKSKGQHCYENYAGKGISLSDDRKEYKNFKKDMFDKYNNFVKIHGEKNTTIDRIDNNKGYYKENCKWATIKEQANNRTNNRKVIYNGKEYNSLSSLCDDLGITNKYKLISSRLLHGRSIERAISEDKYLSKRDS